MKRIALAIALLVSGVAFVTASPVSAAANPSLIWVDYVHPAGNTLSHTSIEVEVGETFTLENRRNQDTGVSFVSIVNGTGSVTLNGTNCVSDSSCPVYDKTTAPPNQGMFTVTSTGSVTVRRYLFSQGSGSTSTVGTVDLGESGSDSAPAPVIPFHTGTFDPNGGTCRFSDSTKTGVSDLVPDPTATVASTNSVVGAPSGVDPVIVGDLLFGASHSDPFSSNLAGVPATVVKSDLANLTELTRVTLAADENIVDAMASDGTHLYLAVSQYVPARDVYSSATRRNARIVSLRLSDLSRVGSVSLTGSNSVHAMSIAAGYAFVATGASNSLFVSGQPSSGVEKIRLSTLTRAQRLDLSAVAVPIVGLVAIGSSLFVVSGTGTWPAAVWRYSLDELSLTGGSFLGLGEPSSVAYDGDDVLVGVSSSLFGTGPSVNGVAVIDPVSLVVDTSGVVATPPGLRTVGVEVNADGRGNRSTVSLLLGPNWSARTSLDVRHGSVASRPTDPPSGLPVEAGEAWGSRSTLHVLGSDFRIRQYSWLTTSDTVTSTTWSYGFLGYGYAPAESECWREGFAFAGWKIDAESPSLPVLAHEGETRAFVAASADYVAQWTPLEPLHLVVDAGLEVTATHDTTSSRCAASCTLWFPADAKVSIATRSTSDALTFAGYSGDVVSTARSVDVVLDAPRTLVTRTTMDETDVALATTGNGRGAIGSLSSTETCTSSCTQRFTTGSSVTFVAQPTPGSIFTGWGGACAGTAITAACTLTVRSGVTVSAGFEAGRRVVVSPVPTVGLVASDVQPGILCGGSFTLCDATFPAGTSVTLFGLSSEWTTPRSWTGRCSVSAGACAVDFSTSSTATVSAVFDDWYRVGSLSDQGVRDVVMNASGSVFAVSDGDFSSRVRVLEWNEATSTYVPRGAPITSSSWGFGWSLALSADGSVLAIGDPIDGSVTIRRWNPSTATWESFGTALDRYQGQSFGFSISLSSDGRRLAVGSPGYSSGTKFNLGRAYVFDYRSTTNRWELAANWQGGVNNARVGHSVVLDAAGSTLFVGRPDENGSGLTPTVDVHRRATNGTWSTSTAVSRDSRGFAATIDANDLGNVLAVADATNETVTAYIWNGSSWNPVGSNLSVSGTSAPVTALSGSGLVLATGGWGSPVVVRSAGFLGWMPRGSTLPSASYVDVNLDGTVIVTSEGVWRFGVRPS